MVLVSTIHERIWDLIKTHKKELVKIHKSKLEDEIQNIENAFVSDDVYTVYNSLSKDKKVEFLKLADDKKDLFYLHYSDKSKDFKEALVDFDVYPNILKNVSNFKKIISSIYKKENYQHCIEKIDSLSEDYTEVIYNSSYNRDQLHRMRISHDTLLEYGLSIIEGYDLLKQIVIDKYPYILIDEYQDTSELVITVMKHLFEHSKKIKHDFFIAYYGDTAQNIYSSGVGRNLTSIHKDLEIVDKEFNRRSYQEVVTVINTIRNDNITQSSIFEDCTGGSVAFYTGQRESTDKFINKHISEWGINAQNKLHCLFLTNKAVAAYSGFSNIYGKFSNAGYYRKYFDQLNTDLLSEDTSKLGEIPNLLFRILDFRDKLNNQYTQISHILSPNIYKGMNVSDLRSLLSDLNSINGTSLFTYVDSMLKKYSGTKCNRLKEILSATLDLKDYSLIGFKNHLLFLLYPNLKDEDQNAAVENIDNLLNIELSEYEKWHRFILNQQNDKVVYHTYHSTKGREFNNVIIIMENAFGRTRAYFDFFFLNRHTLGELSDNDLTKIEEVKNLLYVSCSRAIKNLRVLYLDDVSTFTEGIENIFGEIKIFKN